MSEQTSRTLEAAPAAPRRRFRVPIALMSSVVLALGLAGHLALSSATQKQSSELRHLRAEAASLRYQEASLLVQVEEHRSEQNLAAEAVRLGMVPNTRGAFVRLPEGDILGEATPIRGDEVPGIVSGGRETRPKQSGEAESGKGDTG